ncbi:titin-like [Anthonomus grandis grandis]|uniref:titin-like n=1 Tax=Anthonomus grandis grandis TaxID=2921223 RepID=UPI002166899E|nr:titin-like [Anthonomus grandis grandis]
MSSKDTAAHSLDLQEVTSDPEALKSAEEQSGDTGTTQKKKRKRRRNKKATVDSPEGVADPRNRENPLIEETLSEGQPIGVVDPQPSKPKKKKLKLKDELKLDSEEVDKLTVKVHQETPRTPENKKKSKKPLQETTGLTEDPGEVDPVGAEVVAPVQESPRTPRSKKKPKKSDKNLNEEKLSNQRKELEKVDSAGPEVVEFRQESPRTPKNKKKTKKNRPEKERDFNEGTLGHPEEEATANNAKVDVDLEVPAEPAMSLVGIDSARIEEVELHQESPRTPKSRKKSNKNRPQKQRDMNEEALKGHPAEETEANNATADSDLKVPKELATSKLEVDSAVSEVVELHQESPRTPRSKKKSKTRCPQASKAPEQQVDLHKKEALKPSLLQYAIDSSGTREEESKVSDHNFEETGHPYYVPYVEYINETTRPISRDSEHDFRVVVPISSNSPRACRWNFGTKLSSDEQVFQRETTHRSTEEDQEKTGNWSDDGKARIPKDPALEQTVAGNPDKLANDEEQGPWRTYKSRKSSRSPRAQGKQQFVEITTDLEANVEEQRNDEEVICDVKEYQRVSGVEEEPLSKKISGVEVPKADSHILVNFEERLDEIENAFKGVGVEQRPPKSPKKSRKRSKSPRNINSFVEPPIRNDPVIVKKLAKVEEPRRLYEVENVLKEVGVEQEPPMSPKKSRKSSKSPRHKLPDDEHSMILKQDPVILEKLPNSEDYSRLSSDDKPLNKEEVEEKSSRSPKKSSKSPRNKFSFVEPSVTPRDDRVIVEKLENIEEPQKLVEVDNPFKEVKVEQQPSRSSKKSRKSSKSPRNKTPVNVENILNSEEYPKLPNIDKPFNEIEVEEKPPKSPNKCRKSRKSPRNKSSFVEPSVTSSYDPDIVEKLANVEEPQKLDEVDNLFKEVVVEQQPPRSPKKSRKSSKSPRNTGLNIDNSMILKQDPVILEKLPNSEDDLRLPYDEKPLNKEEVEEKSPRNTKKSRKSPRNKTPVNVANILNSEDYLKVPNIEKPFNEIEVEEKPSKSPKSSSKSPRNKTSFVEPPMTPRIIMGKLANVEEPPRLDDNAFKEIEVEQQHPKSPKKSSKSPRSKTLDMSVILKSDPVIVQKIPNCEDFPKLPTIEKTFSEEEVEEKPTRSPKKSRKYSKSPCVEPLMIPREDPVIVEELANNKKLQSVDNAFKEFGVEQEPFKSSKTSEKPRKKNSFEDLPIAAKNNQVKKKFSECQQITPSRAMINKGCKRTKDLEEFQREKSKEYSRSSKNTGSNYLILKEPMQKTAKKDFRETNQWPSSDPRKAKKGALRGQLPRERPAKPKKSPFLEQCLIQYRLEHKRFTACFPKIPFVDQVVGSTENSPRNEEGTFGPSDMSDRRILAVEPLEEKMKIILKDTDKTIKPVNPNLMESVNVGKEALEVPENPQYEEPRGRKRSKQRQEQTKDKGTDGEKKKKDASQVEPRSKVFQNVVKTISGIFSRKSRSLEDMERKIWLKNMSMEKWWVGKSVYEEAEELWMVQKQSGSEVELVEPAPEERTEKVKFYCVICLSFQMVYTLSTNVLLMTFVLLFLLFFIA